MNPIFDPIFFKKFDGHYWVELGGLILDSSIFRTIYSDHAPEDLKKEIELKFGKNKDFIFETPEQIKQNDFEYIPTGSLSNNAMDELIEDFLKYRFNQDAQLLSN